MKTFARLLGLSLLLSAISGCVDLNDSGSGYSGYNQNRYRDDDYYRSNDSYRRDYYHRNHERDLERERDRLRDERERLEKERERNRREYYKHDNRHDNHHNHTPPPVVEERCPPGFSENTGGRCSDKERKNGCKDIRLNSGKACIKR